MTPQVSLIASAVRPKLWESFFKSLEGTSVEYEVVFVGNSTPDDYREHETRYGLKYVRTANIKPAQCYEIARRNSIGETIVWVADDAEFPNDVIGKAYNYWKSKNNEKLILSIQTRETGYNLPQGQLFDMKQHCFFGYCPDTPLMAPLALMSRAYLDKLGGIDRRYVCGQYENDIVMRSYQDGGTVEIFGDKDCFINIDHLGKSYLTGESKVEADFLNRPFAKGYPQDRAVLEKSWETLNQSKLQALLQAGHRQLSPNQVFDISKTQLDAFEPYEDKDILIKSQSNNLPELWD